MYVKVMSDDDKRKGFRLICGVEEVEFIRDRSGEADYPRMDCVLEDGATMTCWVRGNVYILNEMGDIIESFGVANPAPDIPENVPGSDSWMPAAKH